MCVQAEKLGSKFEVLEARMAGSGDGTEESRSQTYHVIKAAQVRCFVHALLCARFALKAVSLLCVS